jgi:hypothetical protein
MSRDKAYLADILGAAGIIQQRLVGMTASHVERDAQRGQTPAPAATPATPHP